ncbi:MAG TPA: GNAT family N-acetyltransferase [Usitatibacter sp.]|nr:GNAT family N-acetyltransferase [Usitatibacter sp.]
MTHMITTVRLGELDRAALTTHFLSLGREDRRLRFGAPIADEALREYVARLHFDRDGLFAVQDEALAIVAVVHVATTGKSAELGLSVLPHARAQGLGNALYRRAVTFLRNRGGEEIFVHCLAENGAMMHLARKNGMRIVHSAGESDARLALEPATADSFINEWLDDQQGRSVQVQRVNARLVDTMLTPFATKAP